LRDFLEVGQDYARFFVAFFFATFFTAFFFAAIILKKLFFNLVYNNTTLKYFYI
jgi:hypothetical protein